MWNVQVSDSSPPAERKCTNISSLFVCCGFVVLMLLLVGYSALNADINRLTKGYDDCGNICGLNNDGNSFEKCGSHDKTASPKVLVDMHMLENETFAHYSCVDKCPSNFVEVFNRCWKQEKSEDDANPDVEVVNISNGSHEIAQDLINTLPQLAIVCFVALVFSYILLILFRYVVKYIIWGLGIFLTVLFGVGAIAFSVMAISAEGDNRIGFIIAAIIFATFSGVFVLLLWAFKERIHLVSELFKEASRALIDVPTVLFEPILTFIALIVAFSLFVFFLILIQTAGKLTEGKALDGEFQATYDENGGIQFARILNYIAFIWFTQFIFGCQHFVIGGTVSKWYFARDKTKLDSPVFTTFKHLINFHLGSVCLGSMLITLVKIVRMILYLIRDGLRKNGGVIGLFFVSIFEWIIEKLEELLKYLVRNAYIIVAKDGTPLMRSGRRAFDLLLKNLMDVIALNCVGDLVLFLGRVFVVAITAFIAYHLFNQPNVTSMGVLMLIAIVFSFLIAHCFVSVFEMTVDTVFLSFCEDCELNDGDSKPYYMSDGLKQIMTDMKQAAGGEPFNFGHMGVESGRLMAANQQDKLNA